MEWNIKHQDFLINIKKNRTNTYLIATFVKLLVDEDEGKGR